MGRGAWQATVHGVAKSWTRLKRLSMHAPLFRGNVMWNPMSAQHSKSGSVMDTMGGREGRREWDEWRE